MDAPLLTDIRNIGIISHIDAGKTTVSERILFYAGETHKMGEVHEGEAVMDWMPQEQERGITITATSTTCSWGRFWINLIDTPGHIDFTIEVERSMRVLDGAVAIISAVEGVQPQTESVWRQADRYHVPRICFINKMDRVGADYQAVLAGMEARLKARPVLLQLPLGSEAGFRGVVDLLADELITFSAADQGKTVERWPVPPECLDEARAARNRIVEAAADFDDAILTDYLAGAEVDAERLRGAIRKGTISSRLVPILFGAALRNKGIQPLLDAVGDYLPSPLEISPVGVRGAGKGAPETVHCDPKAPLVALAFKVLAEEGRKLTYLRIYAGTLHNGAALLNSSSGVTERPARLYRMHAHKREQVMSAAAGDIVAVTGLRYALTGDTLCDPAHPMVLEGLVVPEPVVSLAVEAKGMEDRERLPAALEKLQWEDPTFRVHEDEETGQTILTGMGELHLEIVTDRLSREYGVAVKTGAPRVVYRETLLHAVERRELFSREVEGKQDHGELLLRLSPLSRGAGVRIILPPEEDWPLPVELRAAMEESLRQVCAAGAKTGYPLTDLEVRVIEAPYEPDITTELGMRAAAHRGMIRAAEAGALVLLEPVMRLEFVIPAEHAGRVLGSIQQKRGRVEGIESSAESEFIRAFVPLSEMFGYMTELRSATKGRGTYTMEFSHFEVAPADIQRRFGLETTDTRHQEVT